MTDAGVVPSARDLELVHPAASAMVDSSPHEILEWAFDIFGFELCVTTSLADAVLVDMASRVQPGVRVLFVDTGYHFPETLQTRRAFAARYDIELVDVRPALSRVEQDERYGKSLFMRDPDLCCALRKVDPLNDALRNFRAWASGIRRDETSHRTAADVVEWDSDRAMVKVNPLAGWTQAQVDAYVTEHDVLVNPLVAMGYPSIGCAPCTAPVKPGQDPRSGRWVGRDKSECGIHLPLLQHRGDLG